MLKLRTNMRARLTGDTDSARFAAQLLKVGNGRIPHLNEDQEINIPDDFGTCVSSLAQLKDAVYPNLNENIKSLEWIRDRAILAAKNTTVSAINSTLLNQMSGNAKEYKSIDTVLDQDNSLVFPVEYLNSLEISGLPPHNLKLKPGCPVMLLRNLGNNP